MTAEEIKQEVIRIININCDGGVVGYRPEKSIAENLMSVHRVTAHLAAYFKITFEHGNLNEGMKCDDIVNLIELKL